MLESVVLEMTEVDNKLSNPIFARETLGKFQRAKILEVYFLRIDDRTPDEIPADLKDLYSMDLLQIKNYLLMQKPHDPILEKIFQLMN